MSNVMEHFMSDSFSVDGIWYLPGQDTDDGINGVLEYSPGSITLKLQGKLDTDVSDGILTLTLANPSKIVIWGFSQQGERYTLCDCFSRGSQLPIPGYETESYLVNYFFVGDKHIEEHELLVESITFSMTHLTSWLQPNIITERYKDDKHEIVIDTSEFKGSKMAASIPSMNLTLVEKVTYSLNRPPIVAKVAGDDLNIHYFSYYLLQSSEQKPRLFRLWFDDVHILRRLFSLLIGFPLLFLFINVKWISEDPLTDTKENNKDSGWCRLFFNQVGQFDLRESVLPQIRSSALFFKQDLSHRWSTILDLWFARRADFSLTIYPYIADSNLPAYATTRFLNAVRGLESCHRIFLESKMLLGDTDSSLQIDHDRNLIVNFINENVSTYNREDFINQLFNPSRISLRKRLIDLFENAPTQLIEALFGQLDSKKRNKLFTSIIQTRNHLTHSEQVNQYPLLIEDPKQLGLYADRFNVLLQYFVLRELGIESSVIASRLIGFERNSRLLHDKEI